MVVTADVLIDELIELLVHLSCIFDLRINDINAHSVYGNCIAQFYIAINLLSFLFLHMFGFIIKNKLYFLQLVKEEHIRYYIYY